MTIAGTITHAICMFGYMEVWIVRSWKLSPYRFGLVRVDCTVLCWETFNYERRGTGTKLYRSDHHFVAKTIILVIDHFSLD